MLVCGWGAYVVDEDLMPHSPVRNNIVTLCHLFKYIVEMYMWKLKIKMFKQFVTKMKSQQGRIHGYPSHVDEHHIIGHSIIWAGAVRPKTKKRWSDGATDRLTDLQSGM